jgi:hypothetical protein
LTIALLGNVAQSRSYKSILFHRLCKSLASRRPRCCPLVAPQGAHCGNGTIATIAWLHR